MEIGAKMATQQEKSPKIPKNLSRTSSNFYVSFSLSGLFISVLRVPEEKLAVHNF